MARGNGSGTDTDNATPRGGARRYQLYHGTSAANAAEIARHGFRLDWPRESDNKVWLSDSIPVAASYGEVVLEVEATLNAPLEIEAGERAGDDGRDPAAHDAVCVLYPSGHRTRPGVAARIVTVRNPALLRAVGLLRDDAWRMGE